MLHQSTSLKCNPGTYAYINIKPLIAVTQTSPYDNNSVVKPWGKNRILIELAEFAR